MDCIKKITVLTFLLLPALQAKPGKNPDRQAEIAALKHEKDSLYKQINDAIDDSVKTFKNSNDSDMKLGLQYVLDLKKHLKDMNASDDALINSETRRRGKGSLNKYNMISDMRKAKDGLDDKEFIDQLFHKKDSSNKDMTKYLEREAMDKRIREWMESKAAEKDTIVKYKVKTKDRASALRERECPNFGIKKPQAGRGSGKKQSFSGVYPCCRKCCKSSYMGCL